jgi:hypothetical protein
MHKRTNIQLSRADRSKLKAVVANAALTIFETEARNAGINYGLRSLTDSRAKPPPRSASRHGCTI